MEVWMCNMLTLLFGYNWFIGDITYGSLDVQYVDIIIWL